MIGPIVSLVVYAAVADDGAVFAAGKIFLFVAQHASLDKSFGDVGMHAGKLGFEILSEPSRTATGKSQRASGN